MAAITKLQPPAQRTRRQPVNQVWPFLRRLLVPVGLALVIFFLSRINLGALAVVLVLIIEVWPYRSESRVNAAPKVAPAIIMGAVSILVIALLPKIGSQVGVAALYLVWRAWAPYTSHGSLTELVRYLAVQAMAFEAIFLAAAIWNTGATPVVAAVWGVAFIITFSLFTQRGDRSASLMAAVWALVAAECAWLFMVWLISYVAPAGYVIVPQPVLVLTALAYCFGGVYYAQRQEALSRARLTEYIVIGLIVFLMVLAATPWHDAA